jgi:hypothetical protein
MHNQSTFNKGGAKSTVCAIFIIYTITRQMHNQSTFNKGGAKSTNCDLFIIYTITRQMHNQSTFNKGGAKSTNCDLFIIYTITRQMHNQSQIIIGALHEKEFHPDYQIVAPDPLYLSCGDRWSNDSMCDHICSRAVARKRAHKTPAFQATNWLSK